MCGGGGRSIPPDNSAAVAAAEAERNREIAAIERERDAADQRRLFEANMGVAQNTARERANNRFTALGLDPSQYSNMIEDAITGRRMQIADLDPNPGQYFGDDFIDNAITRQTMADRTRFGRELDRVFAPGREDSIFTDTMDDSYIDSVLARQRGEAMRTLDSAKKRGNLNDTGYSAAMARLDEMANAGRSTAQDLGGAVLQRYRQQLRGVGDEARNALSSYDLGDTFDPGTYTSRYDNTARDLSGRLEGDINAALSGQTFFDIGDIITRGGSAQGAQNPRTEMLDVLAERDRVRNANRGVGGTGTF